MTGIHGLLISDTPVAVIDLETTGLSPGRDRIVELSVVRHNPGEEPRLVLDTLIHPERKVAATKIHGITDDDVADAPHFRDIAGDLVDALAGCVVASYNVYFDVKFLHYELTRIGLDRQMPHFCLMYMIPMLDLGCRCKLDQACQNFGIPYEGQHIASTDALAASALFRECTTHLKGRGIRVIARQAA